MNGWVVTVVALATITGVTAWATLSPWAPCRPCRGCGTVRNRRTGRWAHHCTRCLGTGKVERPIRRLLRGVTRGALFRRPPERPHGEAQTFGLGGLPFAGKYPSGRPKRRGGW